MKIFSNIRLILLSVLVVLSFASCGGTLLSPAYTQAVEKGEVFYTRQNIRYSTSMIHGHIASAANYEKGFIIPVNTQVTIIDVSGSALRFKTKSKEIILKVHPKYTGMTVSDVSQQFFSTHKTDLKGFSKLDLDAIYNAEATKGASKEAILIAKGYPPANKTASIRANKWKYYKRESSSGSSVYFKDNIVIPKPEVQRREVIYEDNYYPPVVVPSAPSMPRSPSMPRAPRASDFRPF